MTHADAHDGGGVAMLHAWRLPFLRRGLATARPPSAEAAKALGLVDDMDGFYAEQFHRHGARPDRLTEVLDRHARAIRAWLERWPAGTTLSVEDLRWLARRWEQVLTDLHH